MSSLNSIVLIVDHSSPTEALAMYLAGRGLTCVNIWSSMEAYEKLFRIPNYTYVVESFVFRGMQHLRDKIDDRTVLAVLNGTDVGLELADEIASELGVLKNGLTEVRADRCLTSIKLGEPCAVVSADSLGDKVVVKPRKSDGGYEGVSVQSSSDAIPFGMFAQPLYPNEHEFGVDIVSKDGQHHITSIWRYLKYPNSIANQRYELMSWNEDEALMERLAAFCQETLDSLEYRTGASHIELMLNDDIRLVECNFRPHGHLDDATMYKALGGRTQAVQLVSALLDDVPFRNSYRYSTEMFVHRLLITTTEEKQSCAFKWNELSKFISIGRTYRMHHPFEIVPPNQHAWRHLLANILIIGKSRAYLIAEEKRIRSILT